MLWSVPHQLDSIEELPRLEDCVRVGYSRGCATGECVLTVRARFS